MNNKFITNVEAKVNGETIEVTVSVMPFDDYRCREKVSLGLREIAMLMEEKNIKVGKCIQNPYIQNKVRTTATWVFENPSYVKPQVRKPHKKKEPATKRRTNRTSKNSKKLQKNLDNSEKRVIIEE